VNLPRKAAEVTLALRGGEPGYREVEIAWHSVTGVDPEEIHVILDGAPLELDGRLAPLPAHDPSVLHILAAELVFPGQLRATAELAFGGEYGEEVRTELTAVPLERRGRSARRPLPSPAEVEGWLRVGNAPAPVVAVESVPFELIVVRDEASLHLVRRLREPARKAPKAEREFVLRFVSSSPLWTSAADGTWSAVFSISQDLNHEGPGLRWALTNRFFGADQEGRHERLTEAVAVAGLQAAGSNRPRAVLLVAGERFVEGAQPGFEPAAIREYLAALRVPFFYWRLDEGADTTPDPWGLPRIVRDRYDLQRAVAEMLVELRPQFLAWLDGQHMPQDVSMAGSSTANVRLAGAEVR
jgi:hypothetical protein